MAGELDDTVLGCLATDSSSSLDTWTWANERGLEHQSVVGVVKSLEAEQYVASVAVSLDFWQLLPEAIGYVQHGSPEAQLFRAIPDDGIDERGLEGLFAPEFVAIAKGKCMQKKWIKKDKVTGLYSRAVRCTHAAVVIFTKALRCWPYPCGLRRNTTIQYHSRAGPSRRPR